MQVQAVALSCHACKAHAGMSRCALLKRNIQELSSGLLACTEPFGYELDLYHPLSNVEVNEWTAIGMELLKSWKRPTNVRR